MIQINMMHVESLLLKFSHVSSYFFIATLFEPEMGAIH